VYRQSVHLGAKSFETHDKQFLLFFQLNSCGHGRYVTSTLKNGWVCSLQLQLALVSTGIIRSESLRTHDHILLSQIWDPLPGRTDPQILSPRNRVAQLYHKYWVPFWSLPSTCRATVEVFEQPSTRTIIIHLIWYPPRDGSKRKPRLHSLAQQYFDFCFAYLFPLTPLYRVVA
jgi:hypothetical protein